MSKVKKIKAYIKQLERLIEKEEARRPGYTSLRRADLWWQEQVELPYWEKWAKEKKR